MAALIRKTRRFFRRAKLNCSALEFSAFGM
jgi:hypothetical protein